MGFPNGAESQNEFANHPSRAKFEAEADRHKSDRLIRSLREENERLRAAEAKAKKATEELNKLLKNSESERAFFAARSRKQADALGVALSALTLGAVVFAGRELTRPKTLRERLLLALKG